MKRIDPFPEPLTMQMVERPFTTKTGAQGTQHVFAWVLTPRQEDWMRRWFPEVENAVIMNATGMSFDYEEMRQHVLDIALITGGNICSMLADVTHKRLTEVDRINGAAVSEGAKVGMKAPLNELITNLIHAKEQTY